MIKTQNQTNPKYSFGKSKRVLAGIVDEDINISKSAHIKNSKSNDKYELKVGDMTVEIVYSKNNKSFNECMLNILKQKT